MRRINRTPVLIVFLLACSASVAAEMPSIFIAGDSTAADGIPDAIGWGRPFRAFFDPAKINVVNGARGGRSSRTFVTEGLWDRLLADVKPGDYVLIQFGHNDGGDINGETIARGSLPGLGDETRRSTITSPNSTRPCTPSAGTCEDDRRDQDKKGHARFCFRSPSAISGPMDTWNAAPENMASGPARSRKPKTWPSSI